MLEKEAFFEEFIIDKLLSLASLFRSSDASTKDTFFDDHLLDDLLEASEGKDLLQDSISELFIKGRNILEKNVLFRKEIEDIINAIKAESIDQNNLDEMATVAQEFSESEDPLLQKQAQVLDTVLSLIASGKFKFAENSDVESLKEKYRQREREEKYSKTTESLKNKVSDVEEKFDKHKILESRQIPPYLSTRYCPDHIGVGLIPLAEGKYQCSLDKKIYDFKEGFTMMSGQKIPGGSVERQNQSIQEYNYTSNFDTRESRNSK